MTHDEMDELLAEHFAAEVAGDVEGTLHTLSEDIEHDVAGVVDQPLNGHEPVRAFYEGLFGQLEHESIDTVRRLYGDDFVVDEAIVRAKAVGAPFGLPGRGRDVRFRLLHVFELRDGKIARENAWLDLAAIQQQLA